MIMVQNTLQTGLMGDSSSATTTTSAPVLTPTTLKCITQLFEAEDCLDKLQNIENDGFVVPLPPGQKSTKKSFFKLENSHSWQGGTATVVTTPTAKSESLTILDLPLEQQETTPTTVVAAIKTMQTRSSSRPRAVVQPRMMAKSASSNVSKRQAAVVKRTPRSRPGVKPNQDEAGLSPDERERLRIRRERNKAAAARCRKRRMDQISTLSEEVDEHEEKKRILENTIAQLRAEKEELEFILAQHQSECKFGGQYMMIPTQSEEDNLPIAVKSEPVLVQAIGQEYDLHDSHQEPKRILKPKRPLTLTIEAPRSTVEGVVIETPSNVVTSLGFDALMTSTGLTPTTNIITPVFSLNTPTCSSQQRTSELISSDLNTPNNEKVSLILL